MDEEKNKDMIIEEKAKIKKKDNMEDIVGY